MTVSFRAKLVTNESQVSVMYSSSTKCRLTVSFLLMNNVFHRSARALSLFIFNPWLRLVRSVSTKNINSPSSREETRNRWIMVLIFVLICRNRLSCRNQMVNLIQHWIEHSWNGHVPAFCYDKDGNNNIIQSIWKTLQSTVINSSNRDAMIELQAPIFLTMWLHDYNITIMAYPMSPLHLCTEVLFHSEHTKQGFMMGKGISCLPGLSWTLT